MMPARFCTLEPRRGSWFNMHTYLDPCHSVLPGSLPFSARLHAYWLIHHYYNVESIKPMAQLPNYLRSSRKRLALSQEEVAFLLGTRSGAKVNRHEHFVREPSLATALGYAAIFQRPVTELFAGMYSVIEKDVAARARVLTHRISANSMVGTSWRGVEKP